MKKKYLLFILPILIVGYIYDERSPSVTSLENTTKVISLLPSKTKVKKKPQQELDPQLAEYRELWLNRDRTVPVKEYLDYLLEEVNNQNGDAQYHLTAINAYCSGIPKAEEALQSLLARTTDKKRQEVLIRDYEYCEGYNIELTRAQINDFIMMAARNGNMFAKFEFASVAFPVLSPSQAIARAEEITELKKESMGYLHDAKNAGWEESLYYLGKAYSDGTLIKQNFEESYAYYYAYHLVNDQTTPISQLALDRMGKTIDAEQMSRAITKGEQYAHCCK
jgi:hypothetical protein